MQIIDASWTPRVNMLIIQCGCGIMFRHRADRWTVECPCGRGEGLGRLRERWVVSQQTVQGHAPPSRPESMAEGDWSPT